jgi:hypothetical protein
MIAPPHNLLLVIIGCAWVLKSLTSESVDSVDVEKLKNLIYQKADLFYVVSELQKKVDLVDSVNLDIGRDALSIVIGRNSDNIKIQEILRIKKRKISFGKYSVFIENNVLFFQEEGFPKMSVVFLRQKLEDIENGVSRNTRNISNLTALFESGYYPRNILYTKSEVNGFLAQKMSNEEALDIINAEVRRKTSNFYTIRESQLAFMRRVEINQKFLSKDLGNSLYHGKDDVYTKDESLLLFRQKENDDEEYIENKIRDAFTLNTYKDSAIYESKSHVAENFYDKDFINNNFYDKEFIVENFYDNNFINNNFYDKTFIVDNFYDNNFINNNFYDKTFIVENFYDKLVTENKFYDKEFIDINFHDKLVIENKFYDKTFIDINFYDKTESDAIESSLRSELLTKMTEENGDLRVHADLIPSSNGVYDLGSSSNKFRNLYLSGSTINLGPQTISSDSSGIKVRSLTLGPSDGHKIQLKVSTSTQTNKPSLKILTFIDEVAEDVIIENEQLVSLQNSVENLESSTILLDNRLSNVEESFASFDTTALTDRVSAVELDVIAKNESVNSRIDDLDSTLGSRIGIAETNISANKIILETSISNLSGVVASNKSDIELSLDNLSGVITENKADIEESLNTLGGVVATNKSDIEASLEILDGVVAANKSDIETSLGNLSEVVTAHKTDLEISLDNLSDVVSENKSDIETSLQTLDGVVATNKTEIETSLGNLEEIVSENKSDIETSLQTLDGVVATNKLDIETSLGNLEEIVSQNKLDIETSLQSLNGVVATNKLDIETSLQTLDGVVATNKLDVEESLQTLGGVVVENKTEIETSLQTLGGVVASNKTEIETSLQTLGGVVASNKTEIEASLGNLSDIVSHNKSDIEASLQTLDGVVTTNKTEIEASLQTLDGVVTTNKTEIEASLQTLNGVVSQNKSDIETSLQTLDGVVATNKTEIETSLQTLDGVVATNKTEIETSLQTLDGVVSQNKSEIETSLQTLEGVVATNKSDIEASLQLMDGVVATNKSEINQSLNQVVYDTNARLLDLEDRDQIFTSLIVAGSETTSSSVSQDPGSLFVESEIVSGGPLVVRDDTQSGFDSTSGSFFGSIATDGGVGVAKNIECGGTVISGNILKLERQVIDISDDVQASELSIFPNSSSVQGTEMESVAAVSTSTYEVGTYDVPYTFSPTSGIYYIMLCDTVSSYNSSAPVSVASSVCKSIYYDGVIGSSNAEFLTISTANMIKFNIYKRGTYSLLVKNIVSRTLFPSGTYVANATNTSKYPLTYGTFSGGTYSNLASSFPINLYHTNGTQYVKFSDLGGDGDYIIKTYYKSWNYDPNLSESMFIQIKNNQTFASHMTIQDGFHPSISYSVANKHITVTPGASVPLTFQSESYNSSNYYIDVIKLNASDGFNYTFTPGATSGSVGVFNSSNIALTPSSLKSTCVPDSPNSNTENGEYMYIVSSSLYGTRVILDKFKNGSRDEKNTGSVYNVKYESPFDITAYRVKLHNIIRNRASIDGHLSITSTLQSPIVISERVAVKQITCLSDILSIDADRVHFRTRNGNGNGNTVLSIYPGQSEVWGGSNGEVYMCCNGLHFNVVNLANSAYANIRAQNFIISSDDRLKEKERLIDNGLDVIRKVRPEIYLKKPNLTSVAETEWSIEAGVIAQQVWYRVPELRHLVHTTATPDENVQIPDDPTQDPDYSSWGQEPATVNYIGFIPYLISAVQELSRENEALRRRVEILES